MPGTHFHLDSTNTSVTFAVRWLGLITVRGRFREVEGVIRVPESFVENADVAVDVAVASVATGVRLRDRHLRGAEFLDASRFPVISFRSNSIDRANGAFIIHGALTLRGLERRISVTCPVRTDHQGNNGAPPQALLSADLVVPRLEHDVGAARGIHRLNPLLYAIGTLVSVRVEVMVPAALLLPATLPLPVHER